MIKDSNFLIAIHQPQMISQDIRPLDLRLSRVGSDMANQMVSLNTTTI
jgi:hypothetical protein